MRRVRAVLLATLACLLVASPAAGAKPVMEREDLNEIGVLDPFLTEACGVDVFSDIVGHAIFRTWTDAEGNPTRELHNFAVRVRYHSEFGEVRTLDVGIDRVTHNPDGSITLTVIGNVQSIQLPGQGRVYADVGMTIFHITFPDPEGDPVFEIVRQAGQHEGDQLAVICGVLAP